MSDKIAAQLLAAVIESSLGMALKDLGYTNTHIEITEEDFLAEGEE
jgi:hypothetical protein